MKTHDRIKVLCHKEISPILMNGLKDFPYEILCFNKYDEEEICSLVEDVDVLVSWLATEKIIGHAKKLKLIQSWGAGVDGINLQEAEKRSIKICNMSGANAKAVAEYTVCAILLLSRGICFFDNIVKNGLWKSWDLREIMGPKELYGKELHDKTLGILGYGNIGKEIARKASALNMKILAIKKHSVKKRDKFANFIGSIKDLALVLSKSDFISVNLPFTPETRNILSHKEFKTMRSTAFLINTSRGGVVDERALYEALKEGWIAGAVLDVFEEEPMSPDNPLLKLKNVILTPHIAGLTLESTRKMSGLAIENITRFIEGRPLVNIVNLERGY